MYKLKAFKIMILAIVLNAIAFGAYLYILSDIRSKNKYLASVAGEFATASEKEQKIADIKSDVRINADNKAYLDAHFVDGGNIADFFGEIEELGRQAGVSVEIGTADFTKDKVKKLKLSFRAVGSYNAVYTFVRLLESSKHEFAEKRVALSRDFSQATEGAKPGVSLWRGEFELDLISLSAK